MGGVITQILVGTLVETILNNFYQLILVALAIEIGGMLTKEIKHETCSFI